MTAERRSGMDQPFYDWSPIVSRPPLAWPAGARLALWVVVYFEDWELEPPTDSYRAPGVHGTWWSHFPDLRTYTYREHGHRVGIFRVMELLDRYGLRATVASNAAACARFPFVVQECLARGWEFIGHGSHATRMITSRMSEADERAVIGESIAAIERATGQRPTGWLGQDFGESPRTLGLLADAGLDYVCDWPNDDQPYMIGEDRRLVSLPYHIEWDDLQLLWLRNVSTTRYPGLVGDAFDRLWREGDTGGRTFSLGVHPWLIGRPHRIRYLDEALRRIAEYDYVWPATGGEIATHFRTQPTARRSP